MRDAPGRLEAIVARTAGEPVPPEIAAMALVVRRRHGPRTAAVLAYGSSLRGVPAADTLIDLYVLTDDWSAVSTSPLARLGCWLLPPNVYYAESAWDGTRLRAKSAVVPLARFAARMAATTANPYFWARFAQPCRIVYGRDAAARDAVIGALAQAVRTMIAASLPLARPGDGPIELWQRGLAETYRTELRAEAASRAGEIVAADPDYYRSVTEAVLGVGWSAVSGPEAAAVRLWRRRVGGKVLSVLRLLKAAFTFQGGADYLAWKIARHSGAAIELRPWQRRHPILGALWLLPGLIRRGAVR